MTKFEPTLPQIIYGQTYGEVACGNYIDAALSMIDSNLCRQMWNKNQEEYMSPFSNTGNSFSCDVFEVEAYSWNDEVPQPFNFKWRDVEISWYKYLGRGMSMNREVKPDEAAEMLDECLEAVSKIWRL